MLFSIIRLGFRWMKHQLLHVCLANAYSDRQGITSKPLEVFAKLKKLRPSGARSSLHPLTPTLTRNLYNHRIWARWCVATWMVHQMFGRRSTNDATGRVIKQCSGGGLPFFVWMLHDSTKVVVRAAALLSAKQETAKNQLIR